MRWSSAPLVSALLALVAAGAAVAFWATSGTGAGTASAGTAAPLTLSPGIPAAQLLPGGQATVAVSISNPNPATIRVGSFALDTSQGVNGFGVDAAHPSCSTSALSFTTQTNGGAGWSLGGGTTLPLSLPNAVSMATSAANACQGATFTVYLTAAP